MAYTVTTMRSLINESVTKAMNSLDEAHETALRIHDLSDRAESLALVGQGYALLAQAGVDGMDEVA